MTLKARMIRRFSIGGVVMAALLFVPAGSLRYWQGWLFVVVTMGFFFPTSLWLVKHHPALAERRMRYDEKEPEQRRFKIAASLVFFPAFLLAGLDFRFGWSRAWLGGVPLLLELAGLLVVLAADNLIFWVMKVNSFASRRIEVVEGQTVVTTGPYAFVRHPMYAGIVLMLIGTPLALGSYLSLAMFLLITPLLAYRLIYEEKVLRRDLPGYVDYCEHTHFRLVPGVW